MEHIHPSGSLRSVWLLSHIWDHGYIPLQCLVHTLPHQLRGSLCMHLFLPSGRLLFTPRVRSEPESSTSLVASSLPPGSHSDNRRQLASFSLSKWVSSSVSHYRHGHGITLISYLTSMWICPSRTSQHGIWLREGATSGSCTELGDNDLTKQEPLLLFLRHTIDMRSEGV